MKIAILTNDYPPRIRGGAGRIAEMHVRFLEEAGHEVRVWREGFGTSHLSIPARLMRHLKDLSPRVDLVAAIIAWKPDVLLTHNITGCGFRTPHTIQSTGVRWVHMLHDTQLFDPSGRVRDATRVTPWQRLWSRLRRNYFGTPNLVLSPTQWLMVEHQRRGFFLHTRIEVLPNPAPPIEHISRETRHPLRLLFVGQMTKEKGIYMLHKIERATGWQIEKASGLGYEVVIEKMKEADALLVPSQIAENQPNVILEAASQGLPVIASRIGGIPETLKDDSLMCPPQNIHAWIQGIERLRDENAYQTAVAHMLCVAQEHDPGAYAQRFLSLITSNL